MNDGVSYRVCGCVKSLASWAGSGLSERLYKKEEERDPKPVGFFRPCAFLAQENLCGR